MSKPTSKCCGYEVHPAAELFPMMPESELKELAADIKKNGLIHKIILTDGKVLDGRNRLLACEIADVIPYFAYYRGEHSPTEYVLATNLKRRHLTASQRSTVGVEAEPLLADEAKKRQQMGKEKIPYPEAKGQARDKAATLVGVNPRYVQDAKKIKAEAPDVFKEIANGEKSISKAKKELGWGYQPHPEPDNLSTLKAVWKKCNKQEKTAFLTWARKNR